MEIIKNKEFGGERPLFATHNLQLENVTIHADSPAWMVTFSSWRL